MNFKMYASICDRKTSLSLSLSRPWYLQTFLMWPFKVGDCRPKRRHTHCYKDKKVEKITKRWWLQFHGKKGRNWQLWWAIESHSFKLEFLSLVCWSWDVTYRTKMRTGISFSSACMNVNEDHLEMARTLRTSKSWLFSHHYHFIIILISMLSFFAGAICEQNLESIFITSFKILTLFP